jgi:hypothetical protein
MMAKPIPFPWQVDVIEGETVESKIKRYEQALSYRMDAATAGQGQVEDAWDERVGDIAVDLIDALLQERAGKDTLSNLNCCPPDHVI